MDSGPALEELEIDLLLEGIFQLFGHDFRGYQRAPLKRKLHDLMQCGGLNTISALQDKVLHDPSASEALLCALSARPAGLFDDPEHFRALRETMGPWLRSSPSPKVWIAECASNETVLLEAGSGSFPLDRIGEYEENYRRSGGKRALADYCVESEGRMRFSPDLMTHITWAQYNLATDASFNEFDLIVCRNVLADFGTALRRRTMQLFHESLSLFGLLSVDERSALAIEPFVSYFQSICTENGVYRRVV
jgi:chemotaxis protein methyltransferase CheR